MCFVGYRIGGCKEKMGGYLWEGARFGGVEVYLPIFGSSGVDVKGWH